MYACSAMGILNMSSKCTISSSTCLSYHDACTKTKVDIHVTIFQYPSMYKFTLSIGI